MPPAREAAETGGPIYECLMPFNFLIFILMLVACEFRACLLCFLFVFFFPPLDFGGGETRKCSPERSSRSVPTPPLPEAPLSAAGRDAAAAMAVSGGAADLRPDCRGRPCCFGTLSGCGWRLKRLFFSSFLCLQAPPSPPPRCAGSGAGGGFSPAQGSRPAQRRAGHADLGGGRRRCFSPKRLCTASPTAAAGAAGAFFFFFPC